MEKPKFFEELVHKLSSSLPFDLKTTKADVEKQFSDILHHGFSKLNLVTRQEFDAQVKVLAKTRQKLEALEKKLAELESAEFKNK